MMRRLAFLAVLLAVEAGAIVNGAAPADDSYDAVGALGVVDSKVWHCSATLVAPGVVLTARHCIDSGPIGQYSFRLRSGEEIVVDSYYFPVSGDAALGFLESEATSAEPIPILFGYVDAGSIVTIAGWGETANELSLCVTEVTWSSPTSYIQFQAANPGCGTGAHDSGGAVIVREGLEYRVVGDITGTTDAVNLTRYETDSEFIAVSEGW